MSSDLFQEAAALEEVAGQPAEDGAEWREWSLLAGDGDTAALLELVSEGKVELKIDTSRIQGVRDSVDWNSKKVDDDDLETDIQVRFKFDSTGIDEADMPDVEVEQPSTATSTLAVPEFVHGTTIHGGGASCRELWDGLVDCIACLNQETSRVVDSMDETDAAVAKRILNLLHSAKSTGATKMVVTREFDQDSPAKILRIISVLADAAIPLAYWVGYNDVVLVASQFIEPWSITLPDTEDGVKKVFPRRWLDIRGRFRTEVWDAALRAVVGLVVVHPGFSQAEIRWRMRTVYDRQEINDVLQHMLSEGFLKKIAADNSDSWLCGCGPPDNREENKTFWVVGEKHWYQV